MSQRRHCRRQRTGTVPQGARFASGEPSSALTLTVAWARIVAAAIRQWGAGADFDAFAAEHPHLLQKRLTRLFYSRERLMTWDAKRAFVEPDLLPLPEA